MKILYLMARTTDCVHQNTTENELARSLDKRGHEISSVFAYKNNKIILDGFSNAEYIHTPKNNWWDKLRYHFILLRALLKYKGDVVIFTYSLAHLLLLARIILIGRPRPIYTLDIRSVPVDVGNDLKGKIFELRYYLSLKIANHLCDGITAITPMLANTLIPYLQKHKGNIGVWTSGVNLEQFVLEGPSYRERLGLNGKKVLFYHGIMSPNRGLQNALRAFAKIGNDYPDLVFLFVGDGDGLNELKELSHTLGVSDRIVFTGQVDFDEIPKYLRIADIGILPFPNITWWAVSSPIKIMEYLAMSIPVVATDIDAIRFVLDETSGGVLSKDSSSDSLSNAISLILKEGCEMPDREKLDAVISWDAQALRLEQYFEKLKQRK